MYSTASLSMRASTVAVTVIGAAHSRIIMSTVCAMRACNRSSMAPATRTNCFSVKMIEVPMVYAPLFLSLPRRLFQGIAVPGWILPWSAEEAKDQGQQDRQDD